MIEEEKNAECLVGWPGPRIELETATRDAPVRVLEGVTMTHVNVRGQP